METAPQPRCRPDTVDAGFTLMEVIVALALIAIVAGATLTFFFQSTRAVTTQQRTQSAVAVANKAMETAFSRVPTASATNTSGLVTGRTQTDVTNAWNAALAAGVLGVSDAYPAWDLATAPAPAPGTADDSVPLTSSATESNMQYTVTTLIGSCYRQQTSATGPCTKTGGTAAGVPAAGYARLMRAIIIVGWDDIEGRCASGTCTYAITSLLDPATDLEWNNTTRLLAADDSVAVNADATATIDVLDNDTLMQISSNPVTLVSQPVKAGTSTPMGIATVDTTTGLVTYDPSDDAHGEVTFVYAVTVGARSAQATVHAYVTPMAANYSLNASIGTVATQAVTTRTGDTPVSLALVGTPSRGTAAVSGTSLKYTPATGSAGTYSFTYTYTDSEGMVSLPGTVSVTVFTPAAVADVTISVPASATPPDYLLNMQTATGNAAGYQVRVTSLPTAGTLKMDGAAVAVNTTGTSLTYAAPTRTAGVYTFKFRMVDPAGVASAEKTATLLVQPAATADTISVKRNTTTSITVGANDTAWTGTTFKVVTAPVASCGTVTVNAGTWTSAGTVSFVAPNTTGTCTFTYQLVPTDARLTTTPTVTVTMTRTS